MKNKVLVHGVFLYRCEKCGCMEPMYLEKGVEGKNKEQPCPFIIRCPKCGKLEMSHVMWGADNFFEPRELCEHESYFALGERCGKPIFSKDV